jgi:hypothetical protein
MAVLSIDMLLSSGGHARLAIELVCQSLGDGGLWSFLGDAECICPRFHLFPDFGWLDADVKPEDDQVIEQIGAFPHHTGGIAFDGFNRDLAGLLNQLAGELVPARLQQLERARVIGGRDLIKRACKIFQHARIGG